MKLTKAQVEEIKKLIIGEDEEIIASLVPLKNEYRNQLRAEQRSAEQHKRLEALLSNND